MRSAAEMVGTTDIALITLDTLRFDVATEAMHRGETPTFARLLPEGWEERHTPASFTYAAHRAFFAGFLPTPARPGPRPRPFALQFPGEATSPETCRLEGADIVGGLARKGYRTTCIGGVGFFNPATPLGADLTAPFEEVRWQPAFGVSAPRGFEAQIGCLEDLPEVNDGRLRFTFVNVSSLHRPNRHYLRGASRDDAATQRAGLAYVDRHLGRLLQALSARNDCWVIVCSDHGTAYGEDGYQGHRIGHPVVWTVPYGEALLSGLGWSS